MNNDKIHDMLLNQILQLITENRYWKEEIEELQEELEELKEEYDRLEKALNILKENLFIEFTQVDDYLMVKLKEDKEQESDYTIMFLDNKEEYELLKEVLEDV